MKSRNQHYVNDCLLKALLIIQSLFVTQSISALEATIGGLVYDLTGVSATVMHVAEGNTSSKIVIPETVEYQGLVYTVSAIGEKAFCNYKYDYYYVDGSQKWYSEGPHPFGQPRYYYESSSIPKANSYVREVVLPKTITTIGVGAFYNTNITNVELQEGVKTILDNAFSRTLMVSITIPASVTSFGNNIFYECDLLRTITYLGNMPPTKWVATSQTFVPNKTKYSTPSYSINSASIIPMIEWQDEEFTYNGSPHTAAWKNNMEGYTATLNMQALEKNAGSYTIDVPVTFTKGEDSFTINCTYSYKIKKSSLTVTADNATREYGADNPSLSFAFSGFVDGENENVLTTKPTITTTATQNSPVGTYPITISGAESKNYDIVYEPGTLTVTKASLTVTVNDTTRTYGSQNPAFSVRYEGLKNGETAPAWATGLSFTTDATAKSNVGTYDVSLNCEAQNYDVSIRNGRLTITPATLTIKAEDASRTYCDDAPEYTFTCSGLVNGETVSVLTQLPLFSTDAGQDSEVGAYSVTPYGASAPNYDIVYEGAMLNITKRQLTATADNISRAYGDTNPTFTVSYSGFVNNETEDVLTKLPAVSSNAKPNSPVGTYPITLGGADSKNYDIVYEPGTLTVTKAPLTVTVNDTTRTYGSQNPAFSVRYEGLKNGETAPAWATGLSFTTDATAKSNVGTYDVSLNCEAQNYDVSIRNGRLTITPATLTIKAEDASRTYCDDAPEYTFTCSGLVNGETVSVLTQLPLFSTDAGQDSEVGAYSVTPYGASAPNYDIVYEGAMLNITKRQLTATADNISRAYGDTNPTFTVSYSGFVNNETEDVLTKLPAVSSNAKPNSPVGTYPITLGGADSKNYDIVYEPGTLTVTKAPLTVTVNDTTRTYGSQNPAFSVRYEGLKNGEVAPEWTEKPVFTTSATRTTGVGVYPVTVACEAKNYEVELVSGYLNVKAAPLTITASNASRLYYEDNPDFTYTYRGFVNNDNSSGFSKQPQIGCDATKDSKAGEYEIRVSGAEFKNYDIAYVNATLTITKRTLTVQPKDAERLYGEDNPAFEADITGYVNGETDAVLSNIPTIYTNATSTSDVGTYSILAKDGEADNYTFSYQTGTLTIEKADQTLTWEQNLSNIKVGDQVELLATSTSGLSIDYVIDSDIVSLYRVGKKLFLDCLAEGTFIIKAMQNGDINYNPSVRMVKDVVITARDGIKSDAHDVNGDGTVDSQDVLEIYDYMQTH